MEVGGRAERVQDRAGGNWVLWYVMDNTGLFDSVAFRMLSVAFELDVIERRLYLQPAT